METKKTYAKQLKKCIQIQNYMYMFMLIVCKQYVTTFEFSSKNIIAFYEIVDLQNTWKGFFSCMNIVKSDNFFTSVCIRIKKKKKSLCGLKALPLQIEGYKLSLKDY